MFRDFRKKIDGALRERREAGEWEFYRLIPFAAAFTFFYCVAAVYLVPAGKPPEFNFQEGGMIAALSVVCLALGAGLALAAALIRFRTRGKYDNLWLIVAAGFLFLAFDEVLQFHERADRLVFEKIISPEIFQNWNDLIVAAYGGVALLVMAALLPRILSYRAVPETFAAAFVFYAIHTLIDSMQTSATLQSQIFEESAKAFSVVFLALGALAGLSGNLRRYVSAGASEETALRPEKISAVRLHANSASGLREGKPQAVR